MLPVIFDNSVVDAMNTTEFQSLWDETMAVWVPTLAELSHLPMSDLEMLSNQPLPVGAPERMWLVAVKRRNLSGLEFGKRLGWWKDYTVDGPISPVVTKLQRDYHDKTMAHVMADLGWFPSVSQARKNGWDKPVELGTHRVGKNRIVTIV